MLRFQNTILGSQITNVFMLMHSQSVGNSEYGTSFPIFQFVRTEHSDFEGGQGQGHSVSSTMENSTLVAKTHGTFSRYTSINSKEKGITKTSTSDCRPSTSKENAFDSIQSIRDSFRKRGLS